MRQSFKKWMCDRTRRFHSIFAFDYLELHEEIVLTFLQKNKFDGSDYLNPR